MIHDSSPWKMHLVRDADLIERWAARTGHSERRSFLIERTVFLAAYAIRKLDEAAKVSTDLLAARMAVSRFPPMRDFSTTRHKFDFASYFDLGRPERMELPRRRVLNLLVHSLVFAEVVGPEDTIDAFMVTSDREQSRGLIQVEMAAFVGLIRLAAADYPTSTRQAWDESANRWRTWAGHGEPPF